MIEIPEEKKSAGRRGGGVIRLLSPATKWQGDTGIGADVRPSALPSVRPSVRPSFRPSVLPSVRHVSFPEQNTKTVRDILTKLDTKIGLVVNWCLLIVWDFWGFYFGIFWGFGIFLGIFFLGDFL